MVFLSSLRVRFEVNLIELGAIIFGGNFIVRGQLPGMQFSSGATVLEPLLTIYYVIIRKIMFPRKSEEEQKQSFADVLQNKCF